VAQSDPIAPVTEEIGPGRGSQGAQKGSLEKPPESAPIAPAAPTEADSPQVESLPEPIAPAESRSPKFDCGDRVQIVKGEDRGAIVRIESVNHQAMGFFTYSVVFEDEEGGKGEFEPEYVAIAPLSPAESPDSPIAPADAETMQKIAIEFWGVIQSSLAQMFGWDAPGTKYDRATIEKWLESQEQLVRDRIGELLALHFGEEVPAPVAIEVLDRTAPAPIEETVRDCLKRIRGILDRKNPDAAKRALGWLKLNPEISVEVRSRLSADERQDLKNLAFSKPDGEVLPAIAPPAESEEEFDCGF
jgi:hypothetical protein